VEKKYNEKDKSSEWERDKNVVKVTYESDSEARISL